jgi:hypothetical protein
MRLFRFGSIATEMGFRWNVRYSSDNDRTADIAGGQVRAKTESAYGYRAPCSKTICASTDWVMSAPVFAS